MSNKLFNKEEVEFLKRNSNVNRVTKRCIFFMEEFRTKAIEEYENGKSGINSKRMDCPKRFLVSSEYTVSLIETASQNKWSKSKKQQK